jgi:ABC-type transport system involved in multi-copper enzyme maturation permease subunit
MVLEIVLKELRENFKTLRFYLILILTIVLFVASSVVFLKEHKQKGVDYRNDVAENESLLNRKSSSLYGLAVFEQSLIKRPNTLELISEAHEKDLPNKFETDIFYVSFPQVEGRSNVLVREYRNLDWAFIVAVVLSFLAFVLGYDTVCGEKEQKTLSLVFSNSVKTSHVFMGKFLGLLITLLVPFIIGIILGLLIINITGGITFDYGRIVLFIFVSIIYLSLFLLIGMTVSSIFYQTITSAVTLLFIWVVTAFVIPAAGHLIAQRLYPVPSRSEIQEKIRITWDDIYKTKYKGTDAGRWDGDPFKPWVPLRAQWSTDLMNAQNRIYDDYIRQMINQVERTKWITRVSPVSVFRYLTEEISSTGVGRFRDFYSQVNQYKRQLYEFVEEKDRLDPKSPHLLTLPITTGNAGISELPVEFSSIPRFDEQLSSLKDNLEKIIIDLALLTVLSIIFFYSGFILFVRYDKR